MAVGNVIRYIAWRQLQEENCQLKKHIEELSDENRALQDEISIVNDIISPVIDEWRKENRQRDSDPHWWEILQWLVDNRNK